MASTLETTGQRGQGLRSSNLRRPFPLTLDATRLAVDPDSSILTCTSLSERRALFGTERLSFFKVQAGVTVPAAKPDWGIKVSPFTAQFAGRLFDSIELVQTLEFYKGTSTGYVRRVKMRNSGQGPLKLRILGITDPSAAQLSGDSGTWGSLGLNAFNRGSHVAVDEVADIPSARVVGAVPQPSRFYLTTDRRRALEHVGLGELPESTAGMSGQVIILSSHEVELLPGESKEITFAFVYNQAKLEDALADFSKVKAGESQARPKGPSLASSSPQVTEAAGWAAAAIASSKYSRDTLDRAESMQALSIVDQQQVRSVIDALRAEVRQDGSLTHSADPTKAGLLETATFLHAASRFLLLLQDKKLARAYYPSLRKMAGFLLLQSKDDTVTAIQGVPNGWRRRLGSGFPTGEVPEVTLAVATALASTSQAASLVGKSDDAGKFRERSELLREHVRKSLMDDRGYLGLCLDTTGRLRSDDTLDMAVAALRGGLQVAAEQAAVHRLLEKDFETPYGPRTVPTSNQVYFNSTYGSGQLGGFWTRGALAHTLLCYRVGLAGIGGLGLQKVSRLATEEAAKLGGAPGVFPEWVDVEGSESHGEATDVVAASRFITGIVEGELGLSHSGSRVTLAPPAASSLKWVLVRDIWYGELISVFVGRGGGREHCFFSASRAECKGGTKYQKAEPLELGGKGLHGVTFIGQNQLLCLGNESGAQVRTSVPFVPRLPDLTKHLSVSLESYDPAKGSWTKVGSLRLAQDMSFEASLGPGDWRAFRLSTI